MSAAEPRAVAARAAALGWPALFVARARCPAADRLQDRPAVRLQRGREQPLRAARDRDVRARPEPGLLHQPAGVHVRHPRALRAALGHRSGGVGGALRGRPDRRRSRSPAPPRRSSARSPSPLTAIAGARLFDDRRVGVLAGALLAVAFLPVHYSHFALNDAPTLAPLALCAGRRRRHLPHRPHARVRARGRRASGVAIATKYTAGILARDVVAAAFASPVAHARVRNLAFAIGADVRRLLAAEPVRAARPPRVPRRAPEADRGRRRGRRQARPGATPPAGATTCHVHLGLRLAAVAVRAGRRGRAARAPPPAGAVVLAPAPILLFLYLGNQSRFFARWMLPIYPILCLLAAWADRRARARASLARRDPRARRAGAPAGARLQRPQRPRARPRRHAHGRARLDGRRTSRRARRSSSSRSRPTSGRPTSGTRCSATGDGQRHPLEQVARRRARASSTARRLARRRARWSSSRTTSARPRPALIDSYARGRLLLGRHRLDPVRPRVRGPAGRPGRAPLLRRARKRGDGGVPVAPYGDAQHVPFSFDSSFNYYPLEYERPGPRSRCIACETARHETPARLRRRLRRGRSGGSERHRLVWAGHSPVTSDPDKVPKAQAALVLGAQVYSSSGCGGCRPACRTSTTPTRTTTSSRARSGCSGTA